MNHVLGARQPFAESVLWRLQARYFDERGIDAWRRGEVPHHATSNPVIACAYARLVWAFWQDRCAGAARPAPLTLCELGAGAGMFAFHFIRGLLGLCAQAGAAPSSVFRYVLTDAAEANIAAWRCHPRFSAWIDAGLLDMARFDAMADAGMTLRVGGGCLVPGSLAEPIIVIANYLFDSLPQELYHVSHGRARRCLLTLTLDGDPGRLDAAGQIARMQHEYGYEERAATPQGHDPALVALMNGYRASLTDAHVLVPAAAWRCLQHLGALSRSGMLLLAADKGAATLADLDRQPLPDIETHGSVSLPVNIHALRWLVEQHGGSGFVASQAHPDFVVFCLLHGTPARDPAAVGRAFRVQFDELPPHDVFRLSAHLRRLAAQMPVRDIVACARMCQYDAAQFVFYLPGLMARASSLPAGDRKTLRDTVDKVWDTYFPLGEELDLAYHLACLLQDLGDHPGALLYFGHSLVLYGWDAGTAIRMADCHRQLGNTHAARQLLGQVLLLDEGNTQARALLGDVAPC